MLKFVLVASVSGMNPNSNEYVGTYGECGPQRPQYGGYPVATSGRQYGANGCVPYQGGPYG